MKNYARQPKKQQREKREVHKFKIKAGFRDEHHLKPRERGGQSTPSNLLLLDAYRHDAWHLLFGNKTLDEIILLLQEVKYKKQSQRIHVVKRF